jgi:hypothetical protein
MRRDRGARQGEGYWMIVFAVALLVTVGFFNLIDGIAAIANSHVFIANAHYVVGDLRAWGWVVLILGVLQLIAAIAILAGSQAARWFAVVVIGLNAIGQMLFIPAYPFWSLLIIAVDIVALWGLCAYGSRENLDAAAYLPTGNQPGTSSAPQTGSWPTVDGTVAPALRCAWLRGDGRRGGLGRRTDARRAGQSPGHG